MRRASLPSGKISLRRSVLLFRRRVVVLRARLDSGPSLRQWRSAPPHRLALLLALLAVGFVATLNVWLFTCGFTGCPSAAELRVYQPSEGGRVLDYTGAELGAISPVRRRNIGLDDVPEHVRLAFLVTEDRRFYEHEGLDMRGMFRAVFRNIASGQLREGFSTIPMQLARNSYIAGRFDGRSPARKLLELRFARLFERHLTKDRILELYLNAIYMGSGVYGIEGASRDLFGKTVSKLTVAEGAMLAAIPKAPSVYNPRLNPDRARERRDLVLSLMHSAGMLDEEEVERARRTTIRVARNQWLKGASEPSALEPVRAATDSVLRAIHWKGGDVVVHTSLDKRAQQAADRVVTARARAIQRESDAYHGKRVAEVQGAMVALDPASGDIRAIVGSNGNSRGGFNRALAARRQPGSAFKPFVYAAALQAGLTPATLVDDVPVEVNADGNIWKPANFGGEYIGRVTLRSALAHSANAATVRVSRAVGEQSVATIAANNGIGRDIPAIPSLALGSVEVTPLELVTAYAPFGNGGYRVTPRLVQRIESREGEVLWSREAEKEAVMDPRDAYLLTSMLESVVDEGTGAGVRSAGITASVAGKTGTSNEGADVWFVGYTPTIVAGFWFGFDTPGKVSAGATGGRYAVPAWSEFYRTGWNRREDRASWSPPDGLVLRAIDSETGELAGDWCPNRRWEWFKRGSEPTEICTGHAGPGEGWRRYLRWGEELVRSLRDLGRAEQERSTPQPRRRGRNGGR